MNIGAFASGHFTSQNSNLLKRTWKTLDDFADRHLSLKGIKEKAESVIFLPVREQSMVFLMFNEKYIVVHAYRHKIPYQLLSAIIFTEMTFTPIPYEITSLASFVALVDAPTRSIGPGAMHVKNVQRWEKDSKWEIGWKLLTDLEYALDASARLIHELAVEYIRQEAEKIFNKKMKERFGAKNKIPLEASSLPKSMLDTQNLDRSAWPVIAQWYNAGVGKTSPRYLDKFTANMRILGY